MGTAKQPELWITWPNGKTQEALDPHARGLTWQHLHHGHDMFYSGCYACVCERAY